MTARFNCFCSLFSGNCLSIGAARGLITLSVAIACLFACRQANAVIIVSETFNNYTGFPSSSNDLGGHRTNYGVPTLAEGADSGLWLGGRFELGDGGTIAGDVGVLKFGSGSSGGPYGNPAGRIDDDAGLVLRLDLTNYFDPVLSFDWRTFATEGNDRLVAAYYIGDGLGTPNGTYDWFNDPQYGNGDLSGSDPQGPANPWYQANWTEVLRDTSPNSFQQESGITLTGAGGNVIYLAWWLDNGDHDLGKIDNIVVQGELVPEPGTFVLAGFGIGAVGCVALRRRARKGTFRARQNNARVPARA